MEKKNTSWVTFCSQTGGEIMRLSSKLGLNPSCVVTNSFSRLSSEVVEWLEENNIKLQIFPFKPTVDDYLKLGLDKYDLITLHGYLRIIPEEICEKYTIYNGHPGLITHFEILKGHNPQQKAFVLKHTLIGSVVHKVTKVVDDGVVLESASTNISENATLDEYYILLQQTSLEAWEKFFKKQVKGLK